MILRSRAFRSFARIDLSAAVVDPDIAGDSNDCDGLGTSTQPGPRLHQRAPSFEPTAPLITGRHVDGGHRVRQRVFDTIG